MAKVSTLPKFNMEPKSDGFQVRKLLLQGAHFEVPTLGGVTSNILGSTCHPNVTDDMPPQELVVWKAAILLDAAFLGKRLA